MKLREILGDRMLVARRPEEYDVVVQKDDKLYTVVDVVVKWENQTIYLEVE